MSATRIPHVATLLGRELVLSLERSCLYARRLEGASRRVLRATESADPGRKQSLAVVTEQVRGAIADVSAVLGLLLEENGRVETLVRIDESMEGKSRLRK
ncbi:MAG: hypothetical protein ACOY0T_20265 [Myxococcota bacterium]